MTMIYSNGDILKFTT